MIFIVTLNCWFRHIYPCKRMNLGFLTTTILSCTSKIRKNLTHSSTPLIYFSQDTDISLWICCFASASVYTHVLLCRALLQPGRFDFEVPIRVPDLKGRQEILDLYLKKLKLDDNVDVHMIAKTTIGYVQVI